MFAAAAVGRLAVKLGECGALSRLFGRREAGFDRDGESPMALSTEDVAKIAHLSRIRVADPAALAAELGSVLQWIDRLQAIDVTGVAPMAHPGGAVLRLRDDVVTDGGDPALGDAPMAADGYYLVPKAVT